MTTKRRKRHNPEQVVRKLRDADAMLNSGKELAAVLQRIEHVLVDCVIVPIADSAAQLAAELRGDEIDARFRVSRRENENPMSRNMHLGFRCARSAASKRGWARSSRGDAGR